MPKFVTPQKEIDEKGKHYLTGIMLQMQCLMEPIPQQFDYGFDFNMHFYQETLIDGTVKKSYIPLMMRAQLKSGDSYFKKETEKDFEILINEKDIEIWRDSNTPVILIVYKESENKAYWINIREYILRFSYKSKSSLSVQIPKINELTKESQNDLWKILFAEQRGVFQGDQLLNKPIYDFLLGNFNLDSDKNLAIYQREYEDTIKSIYDKDFYDSNKIKLTINFALSQRKLFSLSNAIGILEDLELRLRQKMDQVDNKTVANVYYYLTVLNLEKDQFYNSEIALKKLINLDPIFDNDAKAVLIKAMLYDGKGKIDEALNEYDNFIKDNKLNNKILAGIVNMLAGILCRKDDRYKTAEEYFENAKVFLEIDARFCGILESNFGALYFLKDDFDNAIKHYEIAKTIFEKQANWNVVSRINLNLSEIESDRDAKLGRYGGKSFDLRRDAIKLKQRNEFEIIDYYKLYGLDNYGYQLFKLYCKQDNELSYIFREGYEYFRSAEILCDKIGDIVGKRQIKHSSATSLYLFEKSINDSGLYVQSLSDFIQLSDKDGIKSIANLGLSTKSSEKFLRVLQWSYDIKGDRRAEIGRLIFYKEFAEYLSFEDVAKVFNILMENETKGYNFTNTFDYGRYSIYAFKEIAMRLNRNQTKILLKKILVNIVQDSRFVYDENMDLLAYLNFALLNKKEIENILYATELLLTKVQNKYDIFWIWQNIVQFSKIDGIKQIVFDCMERVYNHEKDLWIDIALSNSLFKGVRKNNMDKYLVNSFCEVLDSERERETLNSYGGGGFNISDILRRIYRDVSSRLKNKILSCLFDYLSSNNLLPIKRSKAINAITALGNETIRAKRKELHKLLIAIINDDFGEIKDRYNEKDSFMQGGFDYKKLKADAYACLATTAFMDSDFLLDGLLNLLSEDIKDMTLESIIRGLGELGNSIKKNNRIMEMIINLLFQYCNVENLRIVNLTIYYLSRLIIFVDVSYLKLFVIRLTQLKKNDNPNVRWQVANACRFLKEKENTQILVEHLTKELNGDISYDVRSEISKIVG